MSGLYIVRTGKPRLLQAGDRVELFLSDRGQGGTVTGVDLDDNHPELGPMFVVTFDDGTEALTRSCAAKITKPSPARTMR